MTDTRLTRLTAPLLNAERDQLHLETVEDWVAYIRKASEQLRLEITAEGLWILASAIRGHRRRIQIIEEAIDTLLLEDVREEGAVRFGDVFLRPGNKTTKSLETDSLVGWIEEMAQTVLHVAPAHLLATVFRLNERNLRITNLRTLAERVYTRLENVDGSEEGRKAYRQMIEDTFVTVEKDDGVVLEEIPIDKAPKYAQALEHGQRVGWPERKGVTDGDDG